MNVARIVCVTGWLALFAANAACTPIDDFIDGGTYFAVPLPGYPNIGDPDSGCAGGTSVATVPGGSRTLCLCASTPAGLPFNHAILDVGLSKLTLDTRMDVDADGCDGMTPPFYTIRYDNNGAGLGGYALPGTELGVCGIEFNNYGFRLTIRVVDTFGNVSTSTAYVPAGTLGDVLLPLFGMADLWSLDLIDIELDPPRNGGLRIDSIAVRGCSKAVLEARLFTGLTITGKAGCSYRIEWATNVEQGPWTQADTVVLSSPTQLWIDTSAPVSGRQRRFYRAVLVE